MQRIIERLSPLKRLTDLKIARKTLIVLMVASLAGFILPVIAFFSMASIPSEVKQDTTLVNYDQRGSFDYLVYPKPSSLYGNLTAQSPVNWRYPAAIVDALKFTFSFKPVDNIPLSGHVDAALENPGIWQKNMRLVSGSSESGDLVLRFALDTGYIKGIFDDIEKGLNLNGQSRIVTLKAYIDGAGDGFTQTLTIKLGGDIIEVGSDLRLASRVGTGVFEHTAKVRSGPITNDYPIAMVNKVDFTFTFASLKAQSVAGLVDAVLENPGIWQKNVRLASGSAVGANFILNFSLDVASLQTLFDQFDSENGVIFAP